MFLTHHKTFSVLWMCKSVRIRKLCSKYSQTFMNFHLILYEWNCNLCQIIKVNKEYVKFYRTLEIFESSALQLLQDLDIFQQTSPLFFIFCHLPSIHPFLLGPRQDPRASLLLVFSKVFFPLTFLGKPSLLLFLLSFFVNSLSILVVSFYFRIVSQVDYINCWCLLPPISISLKSSVYATIFKKIRLIDPADFPMTKI